MINPYLLNAVRNEVAELSRTAKELTLIALEELHKGGILPAELSDAESHAFTEEIILLLRTEPERDPEPGADLTAVTIQLIELFAKAWRRVEARDLPPDDMTRWREIVQQAEASGHVRNYLATRNPPISPSTYYENKKKYGLGNVSG